jgi:glycosyltransferase involved in cell wall biosynthesis
VTAARPGRRALIVVENCSVPFDRRVWREANTLRDAGWTVSVISPAVAECGEDAPYEVLDGIHVYRYPLRPAAGGPIGFAREYGAALLHTWRLMRRVEREHGFDVMQVCNPPDFFFPFGWYCRWTGRAFVFDHHDLVPESVAERWHGLKGAVIEWMARMAELRTFRTAHAVISTNESYRTVALGRGGVPRERTFVVRNGPIASQVRRQAPDPSLRRGRRYLVGYLGIMGPQDGIPLLLDAITATVQELGRRDVQFLVVGDGAMRPWMQAEAARRGVAEYVSLPGLAVKQEDWLRYLSAPDVCVAPEAPTAFASRSTITKVAEYMAMEQPVVAFELTETRHTAGEAGVFVPEVSGPAMARAVVGLLDDPEQRARLGTMGRQRVEDLLAWERQEPRLIEAYEAALASR